MSEPRPFWNPLVAGVALGLVLLASFLVTGHGLGASGLFTRLTAGLAALVAPLEAAANSYLGGLVKAGALGGWITWEVLGLVLGALAGSLFGRRFRIGIERGSGVAPGNRLAWAFAGGALVGFGSRLARGCTSGLGLSGGATLAVAAFVFLIAFFAAGFATMALVRRSWQ
jgi:hypothetical protein